MYKCLWKCFIALVTLVLLSCFFARNQHQKYKHYLEEKKQQTAWQIIEEQISSESKNHVRSFKKIQEDSPLLQHANCIILAGTLPTKKKLLTVGISSMQHPNESYLVDTLQYLFQTTSLNEQNYFIVLVHLPNLDPEQLRGTVANISGLFKAHIKAQKLLVIRGLLNDSSLPKDGKNASHSPFREAFYSKQNTDYALLMNFASNLSDYFLMTGDNVHCSSKYVALIYWTVKAWKEIPWVTLEFSDLRFSGKVFHTIHLSQLSTFFLLFQDAPTDLLLSRFRFLLGQRVPISPTTYLFHSQKNRITFEKACYQEEKEKEEDGPENPPAQIFTSMLVKGLHPPEHAYFLNEDYFQTDFAFDGSSYLVIFDESHEVSRIQVLTGTGKNRQYQLENGLVELGYEPVEETGGCTYYTLLGPLVRGNLDQKVFYEDGFVGKVRCVKLLVTNFQNAIVRISHVKIWIKFQEE